MSDKFTYQTQGTCAKFINVEIEDNIIKNIEFIGGCDGNHKGICNLSIGLNVNDVIKNLKGITCGARSTSCPDQLAVCLEQYISKKLTTSV
jgi:uncharacterized protein (TIGR03905 family)